MAEPETVVEHLLDPEAVAVRLGGIPVRTLYAWRAAGTGPRSFRVGRHLRYRPADVQEWIDEQAAST